MREVRLKKETQNAIKDNDLGYIQVIHGDSDEMSVILNYPRKLFYKTNDLNILNIVNSFGYECETNLIEQANMLVLNKIDKEIHIVKPCETLKDIAQNYKSSESELIKINNLKSNKLFIGQILNISEK